MPRVIKNDLQGLVLRDKYEWLAIQEDVKRSTREISGQCLQLDLGISPLGLFNGLYLHGIRGGPFFREHHSIIQALIHIEFAFTFVEGDFILPSSLKQPL